MSIRILNGDCRQLLATLPDASVQCCVTSPPYFGLRDYGTAQWDGGDPTCDHKDRSYGKGRGSGVWFDGGKPRELEIGRLVTGDCPRCGARRIDAQIGLEASPDAFVAEMVAVFREVRRVLRDDGTLWLNLGDSYAANRTYQVTDNKHVDVGNNGATCVPEGLKPKDLLMMPARVALALQTDGWWLRSDIIWHKPNPMPESVTDRPTSAHEHVFLMTKSPRYFFDADAVREPSDASDASKARYAYGRYEGPGEAKRFERSGKPDFLTNKGNDYGQFASGRNIRNVWTIATAPFPEAHFATFPPELAERCIKAGSKPGNTILDPFAGAGTTGLVADRLQRDAILIELNQQYCDIIRNRLTKDAGMFAGVV